MFLTFTSPANAEDFKVGNTVVFKGSADKQIVKVKLLAENQFYISEAPVKNGKWSISCRFNQIGKRWIIVKGFDATNQQVSANAIDVFIIGSTTASERGIDVYSGDGQVDWLAVKNDNVLFAFAKATEGITFVDDAFSTNWLGMKRAGIIRGAYHFFRPGKDSVAQAQNFLQTVKQLEVTDLPPVLDVEPTPDGSEWTMFDTQTRIALVKQWLYVVEQKLKRKPIIYTAPNFWRGVMDDTAAFTAYPLWIANYGVSKPDVPADNWGGKGWTLWQDAEDGSVAGVDGGVDTNRFNGSFDSLVALATGKRVVA